MPPRDDPRRALCEQLADLLAQRDGLRTARLLQALGTLGEPRPLADAGQAVPLGESPVPIGPWQPRQIDGETRFVRDDPSPTGDPWSPRRELTAKQSLLPLRVCLLGESTAAGWFYAPAITPALVLERQLRSVAGEGVYAVDDLTRVDLQAEDVGSLALAALQLQPDVLVVFAGNNWPVCFGTSPHATIADAHEAAGVYRTSGAVGLRHLTDERTRDGARATLQQLADVAGAAAIPVILVVPEVNLADWTRPRPVSWLSGDGSREWYTHYASVRAALNRCDWQQAIQAAGVMRVLDGGTCPLTHRLLVQARSGAADLCGAREAAIAEVDSRGWDNVPYVPGATSVVKQALRDGAAQHGFALVDLPQLFGESFGALPGRDAFLDYCHLTLDGIHVAMGAVARQVLLVAQPGRAASVTTDEIAAIRSEADTGVEANAYFLSGLYNAHWNETPRSQASLATYWLRRAIETDRSIQDAMEDYVLTRAAGSDWRLISADQQRAYSAGGRVEQRIWNMPSIDPTAVAVLCDVLDQSGRPIREKFARAIRRHHAAETAPVDLLQPAYQWNPLGQAGQAASFARMPAVFHRAKWPSSHFCLVTGAPHDLSLDITLRRPAIGNHASSGVAEVFVNGARVDSVQVTGVWRRHRLSVPAHSLVAGINQLRLRWPDLPAAGHEALRDAADRLEQAVPLDLHPIFGEIFRLVAQPVL